MSISATLADKLKTVRRKLVFDDIECDYIKPITTNNLDQCSSLQHSSPYSEQTSSPHSGNLSNISSTHSVDPSVDSQHTVQPIEHSNDIMVS